MADQTEAEAVADIVRAEEAGKTITALPEAGVEWILRQDDQVAEKIDYSSYLSSPARAKGTVVVYDAKSFADAVAQRRYPEVGVTVYADIEKMDLVAILDDDHGDGLAGWRQHRVRVVLRPTVEWTAWKAAASAEGAEKWLPQKAFANFVEERYLDFVKRPAENGFPETPDAATMLEVAQRIEGARSTKMSAGTRLSNGDVVISWEESTSSKAGSAEVPTRFKIGIRLFYGLDAYEIRGVLRHQFLDGGGVAFMFKFLNLERVLESIFLDLVSAAVEGIPEVPATATTAAVLAAQHRPKLGWGPDESVIWGPAPGER